MLEERKLADLAELKILLLSHRFAPDVGGIEVNSEILATEFSNAGYSVRLATWSDGDEGNDRDRRYSVIRQPSVGRLLREHCWADVIFENNPCLRLSWPTALFQKPTVIALCTWVSRTDGSIGLQDRVKRLWLRRARGVIAVSERVREVCWPAATVIGNPYRDGLFKNLPQVGRERDFTFLGRFVSDKGADLAVRALHAMQNNNDSQHDLTLTLIGDGPERPSLQRLVTELGLGDRVLFTGVLRGNALVEQLNRHRFLWVPSRWEEPFGNIALEGMACGCIPIVSDGGGLPDAVGAAGMTFQRDDLADLIRQSERLLHDKELQAKLGGAAKGHLQRHRPEPIARQYLDVIEHAVNR